MSENTANVSSIKEQPEVTPIVISFGDTGTEYTLEFNRAVIKMAERNGFKMDIFSENSNLYSYPMTNIEELFFYAFQMHHRGMSRELTNKILYDDLGGLSNEFISKLVLLYTLTYTSLINEGTPKNANVTVKL
jgi:hypothetical protein